ncbi:MAG: hypothetical protein K0R65_1009 [Crocinitomicaceae bacterium]|jgi:predicted metal-dependent HD superfamily phosphohydrolase|nr:hypothetical protein [Crocinitomicaceae bacterium]
MMNIHNLAIHYSTKMLQSIFLQLARNYSPDKTLAGSLWAEIEQHYSEAGRHYHTMSHLEHLYEELSVVKNNISDWDTVLFSLFYHDVIYDPTAKDNEEKSAELAEKRLLETGFPEERTARCMNQILATKKHEMSADPDANYFTDADLSTLAFDWENYRVYMQNVRREYAVYADVLYNPGRKKVLEQLLGMKRLYKTDHFYDRYEKQARENLRREMELL